MAQNRAKRLSSSVYIDIGPVRIAFFVAQSRANVPLGFGVLGKPNGLGGPVSSPIGRTTQIAGNRAKPRKCPCVRVWGETHKKNARPAKVLLRQLRQVRQVRQPIKFNKTANRMLVLCLSHLSHLSQRRLPHQKTTAKLAGFVLVSLVSVVSTEDFK